MKIIEINIYGYGKFENITFSHLHNSQVFFGENEAGKSTIMSFIHSILFGFPTKQQTELRYEPKKGAKYGGSLTVIFPENQRAVIERVKGRAVGDVSVSLEDGRTGGEDLLKELLSSIDKNTFQAVYSFNLHGLQNVHQMKGEELGRFLFSTGVIGSDTLVKAENDLNKALDVRFKPNGRNPVLNTKLKELRQVWNELRKAEENNGQYIGLVRKKESVTKQIEEMRDRTAAMSRKLSRYEEMIKAEPLLHQERILREELEQAGDVTFPENGLAQLEHLLELESSLERKKAILIKRMESLQAELKGIEPNFTLIDKEEEINRASESLKLLEQREQENLQFQVKLKTVEEKMTLLQNKLHHRFSEEDILNSDTSIFMREQAAQLMANQKRLTEKKHELDELFHKEKSRLEELENNAAALNNEVMPETERNKIKKQLADSGTMESILARREEVRGRLILLKQSLKQAENTKIRERKQYFVFLILFAFLLLGGLLADLIVMLVAGGIGFLFVLFFLWRSHSRSEDNHLQEEIQKWQRKEEEYKEKLKNPDDQMEWLRQNLKQDEMLRERLFELRVKLEEQQLQYDRVIDQFEHWERETANLKTKLLSAGRELNIPDRIALNHLFDAFQIVDDLKRNVQEKLHMVQQLSANEKMIKNLYEPLQQLTAQLLPNEHFFVQEAILFLKKRVRYELEKRIKFEEKREQLNRFEEEFKELEIELERLTQEKGTLFADAACDNEEQFHEIARKATYRKEVHQKLEQVSIQLKMLSLNDHQREELANEIRLDTAVQETKEKIEIGTEALNKLHDELAQLKYHIQLLEDGGTYAELLHRFKLLQSDFVQEAREWAVFMTAKEMLYKTVQIFKEERLPKMLQMAQKFLSYLTDGEYRRIIPKSEGSGFLIENRGHVLFEANELSQATTEQIYVSIRLALAVTVYEKYKFPIIIDDSFVNFDGKRTEKMMHLLKQLKGHQILFFTCHEHLLKFFHEEDVLALNTIHTVVAEK